MPRPTPPPPPRPPPPRPSPKTPPPPPGGGTGPARPYTPSQSASIIAQLAYPVNRPNALNPHRDVRLQSETPIWPSIGCLMLMVQSQLSLALLDWPEARGKKEADKWRPRP